MNNEKQYNIKIWYGDDETPQEYQDGIDFIKRMVKSMERSSGNVRSKIEITPVNRCLHEDKADEAPDVNPKKHDPVSYPDHYTRGGIEVLDFIEAYELGYHLGNVVKYVARAGKKDKSTEYEDLCKAKEYLERKIDTTPNRSLGVAGYVGNLTFKPFDNALDMLYNTHNDEEE